VEGIGDAINMSRRVRGDWLRAGARTRGHRPGCGAVTTLGWIAAGGVAWLLLAVPVAVCVGRILRGEDRTRAHPADHHGGWLIHHCPGCDQNIEYTEPEQLPDVQRIHDTWCGRTDSASLRHGRRDGSSPGM